MEVTEEISEWTKNPSAFHSLILAGGKTVLIEFYFDNSMLTLENYKPVEDLDDLCFIFDRNTEHDDYEPKYPINFDVEFGNQKLSFTDSNKDFARIRVGAVLSYHVQERRIEFQGVRKSDNPDLKIKVHARQGNKSYIGILAMEMASFQNGCGTRGVKVTEPKPMKALIPTEIAALYSPFFHSLFYGNYKEKTEQFVEVQNMNINVVMGILLDATMKNVAYQFLNKMTRSYNVARVSSLEGMVDELDHCDRFMFNPTSIKLAERTARRDIEKLPDFACDHVAVKILMEMTAILRNNGLLGTFVDKFCDLEALVEWEKRNSELLPHECSMLIAERKMQLQSIRTSRKTLSLHYERGSIVCELFTDFHPLLVQDFIQYVQQMSDKAELKDLPSGVFLPRKLQREKYARAAIFEALHPTLRPLYAQLRQLLQQQSLLSGTLRLQPPQLQQQRRLQLRQLDRQEAELERQLRQQQLALPPARFYLMYTDDDERPRVAMHRTQVPYGWLIGVVTDRLDLLTSGRRGALIGAEIEPVDAVMEGAEERLI